MVRTQEQESARKTTKLRQTPDDPTVIEVHLIDQSGPKKFAVESLFERATRFIGNAAVILLVSVVVSNIVADWWNRPILIDPLIVPKAMEDEGYTGLVAANRISDEIHKIAQSTETINRKDNFFLSEIESRVIIEGSLPTVPKALPEVEIPETKLSLVSAIGLLEDVLGIAPRHLSVELVLLSGASWHQAPLADPDFERVAIAIHATGEDSWTVVTVHSPDEAIIRAAREIIEIYNPYVLAIYVDEVEHDRGAARRLMQEAVEQNPANPHAYNGLGVILGEEGDYDGAIAKYQEAVKLDPEYGQCLQQLGRRPRSQAGLRQGDHEV